MCIAVVKPSGVKIKKKTLKHCFQENPDGIGFAYPESGEVKIFKGYFTFRQFWHEFRQLDKNKTILIHFRIATSGQIDVKNCHPWRIDKQHALIHNGILEPKIKLKHEDYSDTGLFTHVFLKPVFEKSSSIWKSEGFKWCVEESIGTGNKIAILDSNSDYVIYNESRGEWFEGCWFSNTSYKEERKRRSNAAFQERQKSQTTTSTTTNTSTESKKEPTYATEADMFGDFSRAF